MTVKECYSQMGGDYNNVLSRFYDEAMIKRLLGRFIDDTSFRALEQAMAEGNVQEVMDLSPVAHLAALEGKVPFINFFDGFRTSHEIQKIEVIDLDKVEKLLDRQALED